MATATATENYLTAFDLGMDKASIKQSIANHIEYTRVRDEHSAKLLDFFWAVARATRDRMVDRWNKTQRSYYDQKDKRIYYLSLEFLLGGLLEDNLLNLGILEPTRDALAELGIDLSSLASTELDAGLGNGGLGRLAACFLDSMATLGLAGMGYGIRYEYGIFRQEITAGVQVERADNWLRYGNPWEVERPDVLFPVSFGGRVGRYSGNAGRQRSEWVDAEVVMAMAHDILIPGHQNGIVNTLRLWAAKASREFSFIDFNRGDYIQSIQDKNATENISRVLYPNDMVVQGRELRLKQEFFFVSATLQDALQRHLKSYPSLLNLPDKAVFQLNDTHPAIAVAELMRLLVDVYAVDWDTAWTITTSCLAYTNHTVMPEALEEWEVGLIDRLLPRHMQLIYEINWRFLEDMRRRFPGDESRIQRTSIVREYPERKVRMASLAVIGTSHVNGVSQLHGQIVKDRLFADYSELWPRKFSAKTNGITHRRWLLKCNSELSRLVSDAIGTHWIDDLDDLEKLKPLARDTAFQDKWRAVKRSNKVRLAARMSQLYDITLDPDMVVDSQIKRIHEYKRQLLDILHVVALYLAYREHRVAGTPPRTFLFAGKAAPGYYMAKKIIELINAVAGVVNQDPMTRDHLQVHFVPDYRVSLAEVLIPASDVSEQISLAGTEASGTSNMKFALNGALTIGTLDGANIEIRDAVGPENVFIFGMTAEEVDALRHRGYSPREVYARDAELRALIDAIDHGMFSAGDRDRFAPIVGNLLEHDPYMVLEDFRSYRACQQVVGAAYTDRARWVERSILNTASMGRFSSDKVIEAYAREIWRAPVRFHDGKAS